MLNPTNTRAFTIAAGISRTCLFLTLAFAIAPALAQPTESEQLEFIAPFFTADTLAVVDIDVASIDPAAMASWIQQHTEVDEATTAPAVQMISGVLATLRGAGVDRVYALVMTEDLPTAGGALLIPCDQPDTVAGLLAVAAAQIPERYDYQVHREEGLVVLAPASTWERLRQRPAAARPELTRALQSVSDLPHRMAVAIPERLRAEVAALWPDELPAAVPLQYSPRQWMEDFRAEAIGWQLPPEPRLTVHVITAGAEAAKRTAEAAKRMLAVVAADLPEAQVAVQDEQVVVEFAEEQIVWAVQRATNPLNLAHGTLQEMNQLKQIMLAMHNYADSHGHLPPRATANKDGQLLLSWRVMILPFLEQQALYEQFHLDEPWDSPHNLRLAETIPVQYIVSGPALAPGETRIRLPQIEASLWAGEGPPLGFKDVTDGTVNTIAVAIAPPSAAVPWTKPEPWELDETNLIESFFGDRESVPVASLDGFVRTLPRSISAETFRALLTHQGGEVVEFPSESK